MHTYTHTYTRTLISNIYICKGHFIELKNCETRISPEFVPGKKTDVLLFSDAHHTYAEIMAWTRVFHTFGLSVQFWDVERYEGISAKNMVAKNEKFDWAHEDSCARLLVFPLQEKDRRALSTLDGKDLLKHLQVCVCVIVCS